MVSRPDIALSRKELYQRVWSRPLSSVAKELGVGGNALAKICNRLLVPYPPRGYWRRVGAGKAPRRPPLPPAPETAARQVTISAKRASSRRARTRLDPAVRREQLLDVAVELIRTGGLHAASMKQIAAEAGMSETQVYNYFGSRKSLLVEVARREFARIQQARQEEVKHAHEHYLRITVMTRTYLRQIDQRGGLLQMLLSSPDVRATLSQARRRQQASGASSHAHTLVKLFGVSPELALACTVVLTRLCLRTGKLIADKRVSMEAAERMCLSMVLRGSRSLLSRERGQTFGLSQGLQAA
jgi:AcrR family transcriptional regulator